MDVEFFANSTLSLQERFLRSQKRFSTQASKVDQDFKEERRRA
jgi:hypothetical protein